jgi:hypothetical protein
LNAGTESLVASLEILQHTSPLHCHGQATLQIDGLLLMSIQQLFVGMQAVASGAHLISRSLLLLLQLVLVVQEFSVLSSGFIQPRRQRVESLLPLMTLALPALKLAFQNADPTAEVTRHAQLMRAFFAPLAVRALFVAQRRLGPIKLFGPSHQLLSNFGQA